MARKLMFGVWAALAAGLATPALAGPYRVLEIEPATVIAVDSPEARNPAFIEACEAWSPTPAQAARFLELSEPVGEDGSSHDFNYLPCQARGVAEKDGVRWTFEINAAAYAVLWREDEEPRRIGCRHAECEALVLLMPDGPGSHED